jgi:hypothetical protein
VQIVPSIQRTVAPVLRVNVPLFAHIWDILIYRDFPRLREPANLEPGLHVAQAIGELVTEHRATRAEVEAQRLEDSTTLPETK